MKYIVLLIGALLMFGTTASAQDEAGTVTASEASAQPQEEKRSVYYKKVQGLLWMEMFAGPSAYDPDKFGSVDINGTTANAPKVNGPEFGGALGLGLGGFWLGGFYRQANYNTYKLMKVGLDIQGIFRFIPWVHPMVRIDLFYGRTFNGDPFDTGLTNLNVDGGGFTLGAGLRIPIIRWMSFAATFDWSMIGLAVRGNDSGGGSVKTGALGHQLAATFALTFHFIGVRGD